jgi:cytochrome c553
LKQQDHRPRLETWRAVLRIACALLGGVALPGHGLAQDAKSIATTTCVACHGEDGNSAIPMFPKIAGLQEPYFLKQMRDFKEGRRRSDVMQPVIAALKPDQFAGLAAYYAAQKRVPGVADDGRAAGFGKMIYFDGNEETGVPACVGCHKPQGAGHLAYPRIGGQHVEYVKQQLRNFASGDRSNDASRFMRVVAKRMSDEEIESVAAYLVGLDAP